MAERLVVAERTLLADAKNVTKLIKSGVLDKGISQVELADMTGVTVQQINRAVNADLTPKSIKLRERIYKVLDIQ